MARAPQQAREAGVRMALRPAEDLDRHGDAADRHRALGERAAQAGAPDPDVARHGAGEQRGDQVRAAALVLLVSLGRVGAELVAPDRLVLHAVIGGELAAAEREQRGCEAHCRDRRLAAERACAGAAHGLPNRSRGRHRAEPLQVLHRQLRLRQPALDDRQQRERLGQLRHPAQARHALDPATDGRLLAGGDPDRAVADAHRRGPVGRPVDQQAVAQRHPAEAQPLL